MSLFAKTAPGLAYLWRLTPGWLQQLVLWTVNGKVLVGVSGVLMNDDGDILLLLHRFHKRHPWGLPGGWLHPGETIFDCWRREVREETGLDVAVDGLLYHQAKRGVLEFFLLGRIAGGSFTLDAAEIEDARFYSASELPHLEKSHQRAVERAISGEQIYLRTEGATHDDPAATELFYA